jgi:hypothetical protein
VALVNLVINILDPETSHLQVLGIRFLQHFLQLNDLRNTAFSSNNGSDRVLNRRPFVLQVFNFFDHDWGILLRF